MPLYEYECQQCSHRFEKIQSFSASPETVCPKCGGTLEKVISAPAFAFKGAGWYVSDYSAKGAAAKKQSSAESGESSASAATDKAATTNGDGKTSSDSKSSGNASSGGDSSAAAPSSNGIPAASPAKSS